MGTALITGASAGLGLEYAWQLAGAGHNVILVARRKDRLDSLAEQIRAVTGVTVEVLPADLSRRLVVLKVSRRIADDDAAPVGLLVNNAGFGLKQKFSKGTLLAEERGLNVMVRAVLMLSKSAVDAMTRRGHGAILNVSSMAQDMTLGSYSAHKAWVRAFTEGLATELEGTNVTATAVLPGLVRTEFHSTAKMRTDVWPSWVWLSAEDVVEESLAAVRRGDVLSVPGWKYRVLNAGLQILPRSVVRAVAGSRSHSRQRT